MKIKLCDENLLAVELLKPAKNDPSPLTIMGWVRPTGGNPFDLDRSSRRFGLVTFRIA